MYYQAFNSIIHGKQFAFCKRSKQPPLDPKIGIIHATNRRSYSLNLDFADIFKPIIVDRVIFSLINCHKISKEKHFEGNDNGAVLLNKMGKRIFLQEFQNKLESYLNYKGESKNYQGLLVQEVKGFIKSLEKDEKYQPYKYY